MRHLTNVIIYLIFFVGLVNGQTNYQIIYGYSMKAGDMQFPEQSHVVLYSPDRSASWNDLSQMSGSEEVNNRVYKGKTGKTQYIFKNTKANQLVFEMKTRLFPENKNVFSDSLFPMKWKVEGTEKVIDSIKCIKATCDFRGRSYEAWFAPEIPIREGPWKFGGLPGLIISAEDNAGKHKWKLKSFKSYTDTIPAAPAIHGNYEDFKTAFAEGVKKMQEATRAASATVDPSCIGCAQSATITVEMIELF